MVSTRNINQPLRLAILGSASSWHVKDLLRGCRMQGQAADVLAFDSLAAKLKSEPSTALDGYDAVLVRSMPRGTLEQIIFRMDVLGEFERRGGLVVNAARALEIAIDKYLAISRMQLAGLNVPETIVCQTNDEAEAAVAELGPDVVLKPLFGSEGRGLVRIRAGEAIRPPIEQCIAEQGVIYIQRYVEHAGFDFRLLVIGQRVLAMRRCNPHDWRLNVKQGAATTPLKLTDSLVTMARQAARAVGASVAGVDLLPDVDGKVFAIEVNAVPGWQALQRTTGADVANLVLQHVSRLIDQRWNHPESRCESPHEDQSHGKREHRTSA